MLDCWFHLPKDEIEASDAPGTETAGIDLGVSNFAAVTYSTEDAETDCKPEYPKLAVRCRGIPPRFRGEGCQ